MRGLAMTMLLAVWVGAAGAQTPMHGLSLIGAPMLPADFKAFPHVNPDAPKGGEMVRGSIGTFDSFNPFIIRGSAAGDAGRVYDTLMRGNADEAESYYCHLCESVTVAADKRSVTFTLRPQARFQDGTPVTAEDVAWTFETLRSKGRPTYRQYYADVDSAVVNGPRSVTFTFKTATNRELPIILGQLQVLPKAWWASRDFTKELTEKPMGSGPYRVDSFEFGRTLTMARVPDYWAAELPTAKGLDNFDRLRTEYFRDATVAMEAFKAGQIDLRLENISKVWATGYDFPAVQKGLVHKELIRHHLPDGMQGFVFNTRRAVFQDPRVREALTLVFDFEWQNANLFYGAYTRSNSYFNNSDMAATGLPSAGETALLEPYRADLPPQLFTTPFKLPVTDGSGNNREQARRALALLKDAGWTVKDQKLVNAAGEQMHFEIVLDDASFERIALPYKQWLARIGIDVSVRTVDPAQWQRLTDAFDFDMTVAVYGASDSPGNELVRYWSCDAAKAEGSDNLTGACDPVLEGLIPRVINAADRPQLITATKALDRVLLWRWLIVPHWHMQSVRIAYWDRFARPSQPVRTGVDLNSWWLDTARAAATDAARRGGI
jgi:microcin C transport system substrate-binding protein